MAEAPFRLTEELRTPKINRNPENKQESPANVNPRDRWAMIAPNSQESFDSRIHHFIETRLSKPDVGRSRDDCGGMCSDPCSQFL